MTEKEAIEQLREAIKAEKITKLEKQIERLANAIRVLGTNPDITTEEIIKEFTEKPITEEYMQKFESSYISKDKVLKALGYEENDEEYKRIYKNEELILSLIDTLLTEVSRLEDIEDKKVELELEFVNAKRDKYWGNKIRERIKELDKELSGRAKMPVRPEVFKQVEMEVLKNLLLEIEVLEKIL